MMPAAVPTVLLLSLGLAVSASTSAPPPAVPAAPAAATVTSADGRARFSILAAGLVRCEYAADGAAFDDRATLAVVNRQPAAVPPFTHAVQGEQLIVTTPKLRIAYTNSAGGKPSPPPADMCADAMAGHDAYCSEPHGQPAPRTCGPRPARAAHLRHVSLPLGAPGPRGQDPGPVLCRVLRCVRLQRLGAQQRQPCAPRAVLPAHQGPRGPARPEPHRRWQLRIRRRQQGELPAGLPADRGLPRCLTAYCTFNGHFL